MCLVFEFLKREMTKKSQNKGQGRGKIRSLRNEEDVSVVTRDRQKGMVRGIGRE